MAFHIPLAESPRVLRSSFESKFFSELKFQPVPDHNLPRLPVKLATFKGRHYYCLPGPCAWTQIRHDKIFFSSFFAEPYHVSQYMCELKTLLTDDFQGFSSHGIQLLGSLESD